ncbi:MAG: hypothetical protein EOL98_15015 [Negativicutes bacterium]|nr:hypothetical protein [Negativicutes bacterium]
MKNGYTYGLLVKNSNDMRLWQLQTTLPSNYRETDYALILRHAKNDGTEDDRIILYSNNYQALEGVLIEQVSWYNYISGERKDLQGYICQIP